MPAKLRFKGRPKGSQQNVIGITKKKSKRPKPFYKRCNTEKRKGKDINNILYFSNTVYCLL